MGVVSIQGAFPPPSSKGWKHPAHQDSGRASGEERWEKGVGPNAYGIQEGCCGAAGTEERMPAVGLVWGCGPNRRMTEVSVWVIGKGKVIMCVRSVCAHTHTHTQICSPCGSEPGRHFLSQLCYFFKKEHSYSIYNNANYLSWLPKLWNQVYRDKLRIFRSLHWSEILLGHMPVTYKTWTSPLPFTCCYVFPLRATGSSLSPPAGPT